MRVTLAPNVQAHDIVPVLLPWTCRAYSKAAAYKCIALLCRNHSLPCAPQAGSTIALRGSTPGPTP
jgi:hypothetical protein